MTFSIVIPTYNGADFVEQALLSALAQTRPADEIIVSDDNSTDDTLAICQRYAEHIKIYQNPQGPSGFVKGWNHAIAKATSDYISILHQDDLLAPTFLEEIEKALTIYPNVKHLFVPCNYIDGNGESLQEPEYCTGEIKKYTGQEYVRAYQTVGHPHIHRCPGVVTHRDIFKVCQYREEAGHIADDDFFYRVGQYTDVVGVLKPLASYRLHGKSETGHLKNSQLVRRLAHDYNYQVKQWLGNCYMGEKEFEYFCSYAAHFAFEEYYYGIKYKKMDWEAEGKSYLIFLKSNNINIFIKYKIFLFLVSVLGNRFTSKLLK
ncbi:MAG TPA: glycosyltransferase [Candidatus Barnesiella merdigallinarum]|nr:glycosyltransferase [Candidatus Barnesiella merdigallinarum]